MSEVAGFATWGEALSYLRQCMCRFRRCRRMSRPEASGCSQEWGSEMGISISGQVPGESVNVMAALDEDWQKDITPEPVFAVVKIERAGFKHDDSKQERRPIMKVSHIEIADQDVLRKLLSEAYEARTGENALDLSTLDDEDAD